MSAYREGAPPEVDPTEIARTKIREAEETKRVKIKEAEQTHREALRTEGYYAIRFFLPVAMILGAIGMISIIGYYATLRTPIPLIQVCPSASAP